MGDVWWCTDRQLERPLAVKVMRDRLADPRRFQHEARIAARLQHPGITVVHDVGTHDGQPFIVMELLVGSDLAAMLDRAPGRLLRGPRWRGRADLVRQGARRAGRPHPLGRLGNLRRVERLHDAIRFGRRAAAEILASTN